MRRKNLFVLTPHTSGAQSDNQGRTPCGSARLNPPHFRGAIRLIWYRQERGHPGLNPPHFRGAIRPASTILGGGAYVLTPHTSGAQSDFTLPRQREERVGLNPPHFRGAIRPSFVILRLAGVGLNPPHFRGAIRLKDAPGVPFLQVLTPHTSGAQSDCRGGRLTSIPMVLTPHTSGAQSDGIRPSGEGCG